MKSFAVIGNPIEQSRSPELHQAFAQAHNIHLNYKKIFAELDEFESSVLAFFNEGGSGMNVTVPFKEQAFALCESLTDRAKLAGAVNTLWMQNGKLKGDNTDGQGLVDAILALGWSLKDQRLLILGAGGATRGVIYPLAMAGVRHISIANRTLSRAEQLINEFEPVLESTALEVMPLDQLSGTFDLVINATSTSLTGDKLILPENLRFNAAYEMAYGKASSFLKQAEARKINFSDGYGMLVGQAIEAFAIWHGVKPELKRFLSP